MMGLCVCVMRVLCRITDKSLTNFEAQKANQIYYSMQIAFLDVTLHPPLHDCRTYRKFKMILFFSIQCELLIDSLY